MAVYEGPQTFGNDTLEFDFTKGTVNWRCSCGGTFVYGPLGWLCAGCKAPRVEHTTGGD